MGRRRIVRTEEEQRAFDERRRARKRECDRRRRSDKITKHRAKGRPRVHRTPEQKRAFEERQREQQRDCQRRRRAENTDDDRAREAERKRQALQDDGRREAHNAAKRRRYHEAKVKDFKGAYDKFKRDFLDRQFGFSCRVCDRLWFDNDLTEIGNVRDSEKRESAIEVLRHSFPDADVAKFQVCGTCKNSLLGGIMPHLSVTHGYAYPPIPDSLPELNAVEERLIAPLLPFTCIRRLTHGGGQFGIKGQVVNVPIDAQTTAQSLPRHIDDDRAIDVHLKRRSLGRPTYKKGLVQKSKIKLWLGFLMETPLYKSHGIRFDPTKFESIPGEAEIDDNEIEKLIPVDDPDDPVQCATAMHAVSQSMVYDEIAPGEGITPIPLFCDEHAEELSFPQIYLGHPREITSADATPSSQSSSEIRRTDRRGAKPDHVLYMAMKVIRFNMVQKTVTFRVNDTTNKITWKKLEDGDFIRDAIDQDMAFMRGVPNSVHYWMDRKKEVFAMIRQLGKPTAFLTMSASEVRWDRLIELLERLRVQGNKERQRSIKNMHFMDRVELWNNDPVACAIYTNKIFDVILNILKDKSVSPFKPYTVVDFFKCVEFQQRGSPHVHILLWLDKAPNEELSMNMPATVAMAESLISLDTSRLPRKRTQIHQHTATCRKNNQQVCRFGAPFMPSKMTRTIVPFPPTEAPEENERRKMLKAKYTKMHSALQRTQYESIEKFYAQFGVTSEEEYIDILRAGMHRPCLLMKRTVQEKWVNFFNPWIASVLDSNMDIQVILDPYACATYVVDYENKAERGISDLHKSVIEILEEKPDVEYEDILKVLGTNMLRTIEMSAQEAAWFLLEQGMSVKSRDVVYIPTCLPEERTRIRKTKEQMATEHLDENSTQVWKLNVVQKYEDRPPELENVCLADFVSHFVSKRKNDQSKRYVKRERPIVIRYRHYTSDQALDYKREQVLLFHPFKREVDILDNNNFESLYEQNLASIVKKQQEYTFGMDYDRIMEISRSILLEEESTMPRSQESSSNVRINHDEEMDILDDLEYLNAKKRDSPCPAVRKRKDILPSEEFYAMMRTTNAEQHEIIREVIHRITTPGSKPLWVFLTGPAGCGKTFVLRLIMDVYNRYYNTGDCTYNAYVVCASTGKAAVAVGGTTVHAAFKLKGDNDGGLSDSDLNTYRSAFRNVKCVIIDEVSMLSADTFGRIDCRLREITCNYEQPFGGLDFIVCGDLRQLPPVGAREVFKRSRDQNKAFSSEVKWHHLSYFPLRQVVRQEDATFSAILTKIGDGRELKPQEVQLIESRFVTASKALDEAPNAVRLFYSNNGVTTFNTEIALQGVCDVYKACASDTYLGYRSDEERTEAERTVARRCYTKMGNLPHTIMLARGKPYMVTINIDVKDGLVNGAVGVLREIEYREGDAREPLRLWIKFDEPDTGRVAQINAKPLVQAAGERGINIMADWVPIELRTVTTTLDRGVSCRRKQFPVVQASAITVHKSQGATYPEVVYDYDRKHPQKLVYVALSRCTDLNRLFLTNRKGDYKFYHGRGNVDRDMQDEFRRLENHHLSTITKTCESLLRQPHSLALAALNIRSLRLHSVRLAHNAILEEVLVHDAILKEVPVLCLLETLSGALFQVDGYTGIVCDRRMDSRAPGVAIYAKDKTYVQPFTLDSTEHNATDCADVCAIKTKDGIVISTVYVSPGTSECDIQKFMTTHFGWLTRDDTTPAVIVGDFNVDISKPDKNWFTQFVLQEFGLQCHTNPSHSTTQQRLCVDLTLAKNLSKVVTEPLSVYHSNHKAIITAITK